MSMATLNFFPTTGGVKIRRTNVTTNGVNADIDANVKEQLAYLELLLSKPIFTRDDDAWMGPDGVSIEDFITAPLRPRRFTNKHRDEQQWEEGSLLYNIYKAINSNSFTANNIITSSNYSLEEYIDAEDKLSLLKYDFKDRLGNNWNNLDLNTRTILNYPGIMNYLLAVGYNSGYTEINGLTNFIFGNRSGNRSVIAYGQVSAAREYIHAEKVDVEYNSDSSAIVHDILQANPSFSSLSFSMFVQKIVGNYVSNSKELELLKFSKYYNDIPVAMIPKLIKQIKSSLLPVNKSNIDNLLPQ
jgi:hypothetical protein